MFLCSSPSKHAVSMRNHWCPIHHVFSLSHVKQTVDAALLLAPKKKSSSWKIKADAYVGSTVVTSPAKNDINNFFTMKLQKTNECYASRDIYEVNEKLSILFTCSRRRVEAHESDIEFFPYLPSSPWIMIYAEDE